MYYLDSSWNEDVAYPKLAEKDERGYHVELYYDEDPGDPRDWDNLGTMVCWHRSYSLGDRYPEGNEARALDHGGLALLWRYLSMTGAVAIPLGLLDHSGITMYAGGGAHWCDAGGWDSGTVGFIFATREKIIEEYGDDSEESRKRAEDCMRGEVDTYDKYLTGAVVGYCIEGAGRHVDSCWGYYDLEEMVSEVEGIIETAADEADLFELAR